MVEKAQCDKEQRTLSKQIAENDDLVESNQASLATLRQTLQRDCTKAERWEQELVEVRNKLVAEKASQYSMKPKQPVGNKTSEVGVTPDLKIGVACGSCS